MNRLTQFLFWCWFFPFMIVLTGCTGVLNFAAFVFYAPTQAWRVAEEAFSNE